MDDVTFRQKYKKIRVTGTLMRCCEAFPVPRVEVSVIARLLAGEIIGRLGAPRVLLSDGGNEFLSKLVLKVCIIFQI